MKQVICTCDHCGRQTRETGIVSSVEVIFGGDGSARSKIDGIDLCRECYGNMVDAIRTSTSRLPSNHRGTENG